MTWLTVTDRDGVEIMMNFDNVLGIKQASIGTLFTTTEGKQDTIRTSFKELQAKLGNHMPHVEPVLTHESEAENEDLPEPMKAPQGKVGSGEPVAKVIEKLTMPKAHVRSGTTSSALG